MRSMVSRRRPASSASTRGLVAGARADVEDPLAARAGRAARRCAATMYGCEIVCAVADRERGVVVGVVPAARPGTKARAARAPSPRARARRGCPGARSWASTIARRGVRLHGVSGRAYGGGSTPKCASASGARSMMLAGSPSTPTVSTGTSRVARRERAVATRRRRGGGPRGRRTPSRGAPTRAPRRRSGCASAGHARSSAFGCVEERGVALEPPAARDRREAELLAVAPRDRRAVLAEERHLDGGVAVEPARERARVLAAAGQPVDLPGAVGGGDERRPSTPREAAPASVATALDGRLAVVGAEDDARSGRGTRPRPPAASTSAPIAASLRASASCARVRPVRVRGVVVVGEVEDEEVEAVAGDEPAADRGRVVVDRCPPPGSARRAARRSRRTRRGCRRRTAAARAPARAARHRRRVRACGRGST